MGKNSKQRRDARARQRQQDRNRHTGERRARGPNVGGSGMPSVDELAEALLAIHVDLAVERQPMPREVAELSRNVEVDASFAAAVWRVAEQRLLAHLGGLWAGGWQPRELHRELHRTVKGAAGVRLTDLAIANDDKARPASTLDGRWRDQIDELQLPASDGRPKWIARWIAAERLTATEALSIVVSVMLSMRLPRIEVLMPPPGAAGDSSLWTPPDEGVEGAAADPVLQKIRALLSKAESSTFEAEATAFTLKAQELMTRHAIDVAMLGGPTDARGGRPVMARLPLDAPYIDAKSLLLQHVAEQTRCRALYLTGLAMSSVVGFASDVAATEMLFTSLLVQAESALADAARRAPAGTRTRSQAYRSSFLLGFAGRIRDRLEASNRAVHADVEAEQGNAFLPVLLSRQAAIDDVIAERFGDLHRSKVRGGFDAAGWTGGTVAADNARLSKADVGSAARPALE